MALPLGFLFFVLGCVALAAWSTEALTFLKGAIPFGLLLVGAMAMLVGFSERKARRELTRAFEGDKGADLNGDQAESGGVS